MTRKPQSDTKRQPLPLHRRHDSVPVVLVTPFGVEQLTFGEGDRASIAVVDGQLVLQLGERK